MAGERGGGGGGVVGGKDGGGAGGGVSMRASDGGGGGGVECRVGVGVQRLRDTGVAGRDGRALLLDKAVIVVVSRTVGLLLQQVLRHAVVMHGPITGQGPLLDKGGGVWTAGVFGTLVTRTLCALCEPAHAPTAQLLIAVAVAPAVDGALDEAALAAQRRIQLGEGPADLVALGLVLQPVAAVGLLAGAGAGVDAVLVLVGLIEGVCVDAVNVAADLVGDLDAILGVLEADPLHAVHVLLDNEGRGGGNGPWRGTLRAVDVCALDLGGWLGWSAGAGCGACGG